MPAMPTAAGMPGGMKRPDCPRDPLCLFLAAVPARPSPPSLEPKGSAMRDLLMRLRLFIGRPIVAFLEPAMAEARYRQTKPSVGMWMSEGTRAELCQAIKSLGDSIRSGSGRSG
ncbi:hypothetical protein FBZ88_12971 [Nitrospirillum bahiense]|uniref:Uncharacterized protein n=1 Tax=Nitrospirillum amazonense TaxID=28077 RepID=A0A560F1X3_9PROT|nr:hypothetical protein FBZ88_12971 [Nitrospirillum amazonense]